MALDRNLWMILADKATAMLEGSVVLGLPAPETEAPVFLIGCGRSGTTILGERVDRHPPVTYLYEPRAPWAAAG